MSWIDQSLLFSPLDFIGIALLIGAWPLIGWRIENPSPQKPSVSMIMDDYRRDWMKEMVTRQPRMFDAQVVVAFAGLDFIVAVLEQSHAPILTTGSPVTLTRHA